MANPVAIITSSTSLPLREADLTSTVNLSGATSTPGTGASTITAYSWTILYKPPGSTAALSSSTSSTPTIDIDLYGNYLLFLEVTDDQAQESEADYLLAPTSASFVIEVTGAQTQIKKLASGQRDFIETLNGWVTEIETISSDISGLTVADLDTSATGAELDTLTDGSYATDDGTSTGTALHKHASDSLDEASTSAKGAVVLGETPVSLSEPKVPTESRYVFSAFVNGTLFSDGFDPFTIGVWDSAADGLQAHACFRVHEALRVKSLSVAFRNGGGSAAGGYEVSVYEMTLTQMESNDFSGATRIDALTVAQPSSDYLPTEEHNDSLSYDLTADNFLVFRITVAPSDRIDAGHGFMVEAICHKRFT